ncbi:secretin N-terminal domain-containing protein [Roseimaritima ulvae]|uniref:Type II secretion system protein D n=1 Tax=Roseimaritima ulvae TaxID=980254 RepID=A0A5B9R9A2_9BACT|nr:secretin N-terminal domain-containing protein [Roseimaritima ulvae]QEG43541.1 Type II secretion system protein D precursor [Roseimaritima ulvae]
MDGVWPTQLIAQRPGGRCRLPTERRIPTGPMYRCVSTAIALLWLCLASGGLVTCRAQTLSPANIPAPANTANVDKHQDVDVEAILATRGSVTFRQSPLAEVIFSISDVWRVNIVAGQEVDGQVSGNFRNVPLSEVLDAVLSANRYAYKQVGSSLVIMSVDQVGQDDATFISKVIALPSGLGDSDEIIDAARLLIGPRGEIRPISQAGHVLVLGPSERVIRVQELFNDLARGLSSTPPDLPPLLQSATDTDAASPLVERVPAVPVEATTPRSSDPLLAYFTPQFTDAEQLIEALTGAMDPSTIISLFAEENRIIVRGDERQLQLASQIVRQLDRPRPQVRITALIYDVGLDEIANLGIDWSHGKSDGSLTSTVGTGLMTAAADGGVLEGTNIALNLIKDSCDIGVVLNLLNSCEGAKLLADPTVTVADRKDASMKIVQKIPVTTIGQLGDSAATFSSVEFEEAGIILTVVPRISRDGTVQLTVQTEFSVLTGNLNGQPIIDTRTANTSVRVANGQSFVLGGLRQKSVTETVRGVPYLKELKHFGKWFRSHETDVVESELIVFIKPEIVGPYNNSTPREDQALCISNLQLDRIAVADTRSFVPCCSDPYCPNHHPRPRVNGGGSAQLALIGGFGIETLPSGVPMDAEVLPQRQEQRFEPQASEPFYQTASDPQVKDWDAPVRVR